MSQDRETFGVTQNEGYRHGQQGGGDYVPSTGGLGQQPNGHVNTYGTAGNQPSRHRESNGWSQSNGDAYTYGTAGNQPSRHRDTLTEISVRHPNTGRSSSMNVDLDTMTQGELVQQISRDLGMNSGQLNVNYRGKPLLGSGKLRGAGLCRGCTVDANARLRGG